MKKLFFAALLLFSVETTANAATLDTIIKFDFGDTTLSDVKYENGVFKTVNDGVTSTPGNQNTGIDYVGFLEASFSDILANASVTIANVAGVGNATKVGTTVIQNTSGGYISLWSDTGVLLLTGQLGDGTINGSTSGSSGSFFNTTVMTYTAGLLLDYVSATPAGLSLALTDIVTGGVSGMALNSSNVLLGFSADASGNLSGSQTSVPEPTTMLLLGSGILGSIRSRRKKILVEGNCTEFANRI